MKIYYVDDLIKELKEKKYCDELEVLCDGSPIEKIELGNKCSLNVVPVYKINDELENKISDLEDRVSDLEDDVDSLESENGSLRWDLDRVKNVFEDDELEYNIDKYFEMHSKEKEIFNNLSRTTLIDFIKTVTNWYNIKKDIE